LGLILDLTSILLPLILFPFYYKVKVNKRALHPPIVFIY